MNLTFVVTTASGTTFLPQKLSKVTPFSSNKMPEILNQFAISPNSEEAEIINEIIIDCEEPAIENEEKYCATSLESMVEYVTSKFGKNVNVLTTEISSDKAQRTGSKKQQYVVSSGVRKIVSDNLVACHSLPYPYAVFFCHATSAHTTQAYVVPLVGADGTKIKATTVCHKETSKWDPDHVAFQVLKVKPGTIVPICHFLGEDNIVWAGKNEEN
ncbi:BURP domain-containing protein 3-like [Papaver somniferum]|uniref:BURP domain-containing protein 3-like n=1 Tax=Papaver somniferum TaxID=3469 RepID=UPI000E6F4927|nr:BURP domain-containing protein 3-like [Papaver somniferum]